MADWAADVAGAGGDGANVAMYAWRRANLAELNPRGRQASEALGRLSGPELAVGQAGYRAGDPYRHPGSGRTRPDRDVRMRHGAGR
ncbi:MAG: hypothetical protein M3137_04565 [Actinomycetota bacterium]|nr:hypothetical protein [Actinomycetota bacterium]